MVQMRIFFTFITYIVLLASIYFAADELRFDLQIYFIISSAYFNWHLFFTKRIYKRNPLPGVINRFIYIKMFKYLRRVIAGKTTDQEKRILIYIVSVLEKPLKKENQSGKIRKAVKK